MKVHPRVLWLRRAVRLLRPHYAQSDVPLPGGRLVLGVGVLRTCDGGQFYVATPLFPAHIVIAQRLSDPLLVLAALCHELCHFVTESEAHAHGPEFYQAARRVGLRKGRPRADSYAWTATTPTLEHVLERVAADLGPYPAE